MARLACPHCGNDRLWSDEVTSIMYPVILTRVTGDCTCRNTGELKTHDAGCPVPTGQGIEVEYTGESYDVMDEGTEYRGDIWCRSCGSQFTEDQLVEEFDEQAHHAAHHAPGDVCPGYEGSVGDPDVPTECQR